MFAAKSTVEPVIVEREAAILMERDKSWHDDRLPILDERIRVRLRDLSTRLGDADWLEGEFSAGDLLMVNVLRRRSAARLQTGFRRLAGGFQQHCYIRLTACVGWSFRYRSARFATIRPPPREHPLGDPA